LSAALPTANIDLNDPGIDARLYAGGFSNSPSTTGSRPPLSPDPMSPLQNTARDHSEQLESMVHSTELLDLDNEGKWDYHGHSSGLTFIRKMREQLGDLMGPVPEGSGTPFVKNGPIPTVLDSPRSNQESPFDSSVHSPDFPELPPKHVALKICAVAIDDASVLFRILHAPSFYKMMDVIYATPHDSYGNEENTFLPLLYSVLAFGSLFKKNQNDTDSYEILIDQGYGFFLILRQKVFSS
jgi:hypothetical protein